MDDTLLETEPRSGTDAADLRVNRNNDQVGEPDEHIEAPEYRELAVESSALPVRMKIEPPIEYDGKEYGELICDFDRLTGKDFQRCERTFNRLYKADRNETPLPEMKHLYHSIVIAEAADVPLALIFKLPRRYYTPIRLEALKACGSSPEEEKA